MRLVVCFALMILVTAVSARCDSLEESLDNAVQDGLSRQVYPGAVLVVGNRDGVLFQRAYGRLAYNPAAPEVSMDTLFDLASLSKVVGTSTAALLLLQDETLSLSDPVSRYISGFGRNGKESVTVLDLLTHTSGLKAYESRDVVERERYPDETPADALIRRYASLKPSYNRREKVVYSCLNMQTLARVVENASSSTLQDLLSARVWEPLGMHNTTYRPGRQQKEKAAPTAVLRGGAWLQGVVHDPLANYHGSEKHCPGNAGLFSTGPDLARYCQMILREGELDGVRVFSRGWIVRMTSDWSPRVAENKRALGWGIYESSPYSTPLNRTNDTAVLGHTGFTGTFLWVDKKSGTYIVFLTNAVFPSPNSEKPALSTVQRRLADIVLRSQPVYAAHFHSIQQASERSTEEVTAN